MPQSSSSSSSGPCGSDCGWDFNVDWGDWVNVKPCSNPDYGCSKPPTPLKADRESLPYCTSCTPIEEMQAIIYSSAESKAAQSVLSWGIVVPEKNNCNQFRRIFDFVARDGVAQLICNSGWLVKVRHIARERELSDTQDRLPTLGAANNETGQAVGIYLQEGRQLNLHWVTVRSSRLWTMLALPEWEVLVVQLRRT